MKIASILLIICFLSINLFGQNNVEVSATEQNQDAQGDFRSLLREGNRQFNAGRAEDAERSYRRALHIDERSDIATFNLGSSLYRQQRFDEAAREFEKTVSGMTDNMDKARAYHNLGNSLLHQQKLEESIEAYKQSLRNNPNDMDTKYNLSYAMNLLREQEQNQQDQQQDQDQQNQDQQNQDQQQQQQNSDETQQQQPQISREDAQRILDAIAEEERELLERLQQQEQQGQRRDIERNW